MILIERTGIPSEALPTGEFRQFLRLGTGFGEDGLQDALLEQSLRASIAAIEARTSKAILKRAFALQLIGWRNRERQELPVAPVAAVTKVAVFDHEGVETVFPPTSYILLPDAHRPAISALSLSLPTIPSGGMAEIEFDAGFSSAWSGVPADLAQAALLLAAHFYENRVDVSAETLQIPAAVQGLLARYRVLRFLGGGQ